MEGQRAFCTISQLVRFFLAGFYQAPNSCCYSPKVTTSKYCKTRWFFTCFYFCVKHEISSGADLQVQFFSLVLFLLENTLSLSPCNKTMLQLHLFFKYNKITHKMTFCLSEWLKNKDRILHWPCCSFVDMDLMMKL